MNSRLGLVCAAAVVVAVASFSGSLNAQQSIFDQPGLPPQPMPGSPQGVPMEIPDRPAIPEYDDGNIEVLHVSGSVYMVAGGGANVTVQVGNQGLLVVDSGPAEMSDAILAGIREISDEPIRLIFNTSADEHHTSGNENLSNSGLNINAGVGGPQGREPSRIDGAPVIATQVVLHRMSGLLNEPRNENFGVWPHLTFYGPLNSRSFNGEVVEMRHVPNAHTDGDLYVWFRQSDVIAAGDLYSTVTYPVIDLERGGSVQGYLNALNDMLDIAVPEFNNQGGTLIIPGHGRISNESDLAEYRDMTTIVRDRIQAMIDAGLSLEQVKAAGPTLDYDVIYGNPPGASWTGEMFVETVYRDLNDSGN